MTNPAEWTPPGQDPRPDSPPSYPQLDQPPPGWTSPGPQAPYPPPQYPPLGAQAQYPPPGPQAQYPPPQYPPPQYPPPPGPQAQYGQPFYPGQPPWVRPPALKPGIVPLRPLGVGEILDGAISFIRGNPKATLGISALLITLAEVIQVGVQYLLFESMSGASVTTAQGVVAVGGILLGLIVSLIATSILSGLLIVVVSKAVLGQPVTAGEAWATVRPRVAGLIGLSLLIVLILLGVYLVIAIPVVLAIVTGVRALGVIVAVVGVLAAIVASLYVWVTLSLATPAYVLEGVGVGKALSRSRELVRTRWWPMFGILLLAALIAGVLGAILAIPFTIAGSLVSIGSAFVVSLVLSAIGSIVSGTITAPFTAGVTGLLYFDQRMRREGLDIELARAATGGGQPVGPTAQVPPPTLQGPPL